VKGTFESGKIRLVESRKIAKEKSEISDVMRPLLRPRSRMLLKGDQGVQNSEGGVALRVTRWGAGRARALKHRISPVMICSILGAAAGGLWAGSESYLNIFATMGPPTTGGLDDRSRPGALRSDALPPKPVPGETEPMLGLSHYQEQPWA